jgi:hypothetical protein
MWPTMNIRGATLAPPSGGPAASTDYDRVGRELTSAERHALLSTSKMPQSALADAGARGPQFRVSRSASEYMRGHRCLLCDTLALDKEGHASSLLHSTRVILLQTVMPLLRRGDSIRVHADTIWPYELSRLRRLRRVPTLWDGGDATSAAELRVHWSLPARLQRVRSGLSALADMGVLTSSVMRPMRSARATARGIAFERYENIGDTNWGSHLTLRILWLFRFAQWTAHGAGSRAGDFHSLRDFVESNVNLGRAYDELDLTNLLHAASVHSAKSKLRQEQQNDRAANPTGGLDTSTGGDGAAAKFKADVIESICGELRVFLWSAHDPTGMAGFDMSSYPSLSGACVGAATALVESVLEELFDVLAIVTFSDLASSVDRYYATHLVGHELRAPPLPSLDETVLIRRRAGRSAGAAVAARESHRLPPALGLHAKATLRPPSGDVAAPRAEIGRLVGCGCDDADWRFGDRRAAAGTMLNVAAARNLPIPSACRFLSACDGDQRMGYHPRKRTPESSGLCSGWLSPPGFHA